MARIGRKSAQDVYPQTPRGTSSVYARNSAVGPSTDTAITVSAPPSQAVDWFILEKGTTGSPNCTITPKLSGIVLVTAIVTAHNSTGGALTLEAELSEAGGGLGPIAGNSAPAGGEASVALQYTFTGFPLGVPVNFGVLVSGNGLTLHGSGTTISVQEVAVATG